MSASIAATSANAATSTAQTPRLAGDFNTFLTLLTTQLKNQTPTDPLDTNQMTNQLVQFASVEQQVAMNQNLQRLLTLEQASQLTASAPLIGRQVEVEADGIALQGGSGTIKLPAAGASQQAQISILGSGNRVIRQEVVTLGNGPTNWTWNGRSTDGATQADGAYTVRVVGMGSNGQAQSNLPFSAVGKVTGAERVGTDLKLMLGQLKVGFDKLLSVSAAN
jgi:flagellar basal-body rod modification protein FlgD